jgi:hypothetical protein
VALVNTSLASICHTHQLSDLIWKDFQFRTC